jgi:hypothetical protein
MATHDFWTDLLSEHLDGELPEERSLALAEHLASCEDCRAVEAGLAEVKRRARALGGITPPSDLWGRIQARLDQPAGIVDLTLRLDPSLPTSAGPPAASRWGGPARIAAMIALLVATGASGWALGAGADRGVERSDPGGAPAEVGGASAVRMVDSAPADADDLGPAVAELERLLQGQPEGLDANTVRILQKNLALIQAAVAESREALATNPDNAYVRRHLEGAVERQRAFVQQASRLLAADD